MKHTIMKRLKLIPITLVILLALTGCGKTGKCENCGQTEKLTEYVSQINGETHWYCESCRNLAKMFGL